MSFSPKYTINNQILFNIKEITKLTVELNEKKLPQNVYSEILGNTKSIGIKALALSSQEEKNYVKALEKFNKKNIDFIFNLFLTIYSVAMENVAEFKSNKVKKNLKDLVKFVNNSKDLDPVLLSGLFYKQFLLLKPFFQGNERVAVLSTRILLRELDINLFNLLSFEKIGSVNEKDNTKWLEFFSQAILDEMLRLKKALSNVSFKKDLDLNNDQKKILKYIKRYGVIDDSKYSGITKRKKATRVLDFNKLIACGLIERCGKGRLTHYILK